MALDPHEPASAGRPSCYRCFRPALLCYCAKLEPVANRTRVVIVQHPREQFHPINTARMVEGCLERCQVVRGPLGALSARVAQLDLPRDAALLYPSPDALDLEGLPLARQPSTVIVLDGTWHQAKTLLRDLPELRGFRRVRFTPERPSDYRIRKEPHESYLSTLESVVHVLTRLEPALDVTPLERLFRDVIDRNIAARRPAEAEGRFRWRGRGRAYRLPQGLRGDPGDTALLYAESARLPLGAAARAARLPLIVVAQRLETNERLRVLLRAEGPVLPRLLEHLGLGVDEYSQRAQTPEQARLLLEDFLGPRQLVSFHPSSATLLAALGLFAARRLALKGAYCDWKRARGEAPQQWGSLDEICAREALTIPEEARAGGRAQLRLVQTRRLFELLRTSALGEEPPTHFKQVPPGGACGPV